MNAQPEHATRRTIPPEVSARVGVNVRRLREGMGLSRDGLSKQLYLAGYDMTAAVIRNLEQGMLEGREPVAGAWRPRWVTIDEAVALADALGATLDELVALPRLGVAVRGRLGVGGPPGVGAGRSILGAGRGRVCPDRDRD